MTFLDSILLGAVEGVTEFLPVSSTGHLILASSALGIEQTAFLKSFEIAIQLGAIFSVVVLYWRAFFNSELFKRVIVAFTPTAVLGFLLYPIVKEYLMGNVSVVLWALALGGGALILFERWHKETPPESGESPINVITYKQSALIGLFQAISMIPGVSRSAATIIGGLALGLQRATIVEFSFLLAIPTMLAATGYDLYKNAGAFATNEWHLLTVGFVTSFIVSILAIKWFMRFVQTHTFTPFGVYRIILAALFALLLI